MSKIGLTPIPSGDTGLLCSDKASVGDDVEWRDLAPFARMARGKVIREITADEFRIGIGGYLWDLYADFYRDIGRYWECSVIRAIPDLPVESWVARSDRTTIQFTKLDPSAKSPSYAKEGDAGMDMCALRDFAIEPGATLIVETGIALAIPPGYFGSARERSGLAAKGIRLGGGVIDSGYRGEVKGVLTNLNPFTFYGRAGDRIFQIIIQPIAVAELAEVDVLPESQRGAAGFGSTGL